MRIVYGLLSVIVLAFVVSWWHARPSSELASLDTTYPVDTEGVEMVISRLEELDFHYQVLIFMEGNLHDSSGSSFETPLLTHPSIQMEDFEGCLIDQCIVVAASKLVFSDFLGVMRFHHHYRYFWLFREDEITEVSQENTYWGFIR